MSVETGIGGPNDGREGSGPGGSLVDAVEKYDQDLIRLMGALNGVQDLSQDERQKGKMSLIIELIRLSNPLLPRS